jgi:hypothetical protein
LFRPFSAWNGAIIYATNELVNGSTRRSYSIATLSHAALLELAIFWELCLILQSLTKEGVQAMGGKGPVNKSDG